MKKKPTNWSVTTNTKWKSSRYQRRIFINLFTNPDYRHPKSFQRQDIQTRFSPQIRRLVGLIGDCVSIEQLIKKIYNLVEAAAPVDRSSGGPTIRFKRSASNILTSGFSQGCVDRALAFVTLARKLKIPSLIVDTADLAWIKTGAQLSPVAGHFYAEVKAGINWYLVDTTTGLIYTNYDLNNYYFPNRRIAFFKALSLVDVGIDSEASHRLLQRVAFWGTEIMCYRDPRYCMFDLNDEYMVSQFRDKIRDLALPVDKTPIGYASLSNPTRRFSPPIEVENLNHID